MTAADRYDLTITDSSGVSHGLLCDWGRGGAGLSVKQGNNLQSTAVSTKGDFGVRDASDHFRIVQSDWSEGQGQKTYDREADSENAFDSSLGIDVSKVGEFKLGPLPEYYGNSETLPALAAGGITGSPSYLPILWGSWNSDAAVNRLRWTVDCSTWYSMDSGPDGSPVSFAFDGRFMYFAATTGHVYYAYGSGVAQYAAADANTHDITHLAFTAGTLYGAKGTESTSAQLGTWSSAPAWSALSPDVGSAINASGTTFGLVANGNYVYWGVTNGMQTKVYKAMYGGGAVADVLQTVATFPTGFVGKCMYSYLGTVYIGGYWGGGVASTGIGAIYAIVEDQSALLTDVGTDHTRDNRVLSICAYERDLYFISDSQVWRWDLVRGGYSHYSGPLDSNPVTSYGSVNWTGQWAMDAVPGNGAEADATEVVGGDGTSLSYSGGNMTATFADGYGWRRFTTTDTLGIDDTVGTTLEVSLPAAFAYNNYSLTGLCAAIRGSAKQAALYVASVKGSTVDQVMLVNAGDRYGETLATAYVDRTKAHTYRMTLKNSSVYLYVDGTFLLSAVTTSASTERHIYLELTKPSDGAFTELVSVSNVRWTTDGAYSTDVLTQTPVDGVSLACFGDKVVAACSGVGVFYVDPFANVSDVVTDTTVFPSLRSSLSSGNMPTVEKWFSAIHVNHAELIGYDDATNARSLADIECWAIIDGTQMQLALDADLSSAYLSVFPIGVSGRTIAWVVYPVTGSEVGEEIRPWESPVVTDVAVIFDPVPKIPKVYTYFVRCWREAEDRSGYDWDEDAPTVADWLEDLAGTVVTVERPGGQASYNGRIEALEYVEAPPSGKANGREGLYQLQLKVV